MNIKKISNYFGILVLVLVLFIFIRSPQTLKNITASGDISIIRQNGDKILISQNGKVNLNGSDGNFSENWDSGKLSALQSYLSQNLKTSTSLEEGTPGSVTFSQNGAKYTIAIGGELADEIAKDIEEGDDYGGGGGGGGGGDDISGYFSSPTPHPSSSSQPSRTPHHRLPEAGSRWRP
jgi:hypothetical protein